MKSYLIFLSGVTIGYFCIYVYYVIPFFQKIENTYPTKKSDLDNKQLRDKLFTKNFDNVSAERSTTSTISPQSVKCYQHNFTAMMETIQKERLYNLKHTCRHIVQAESHIVYRNKAFPPHNFYTKTYNLSVCYIQKCGYSSWYKAFLVMNNLMSVDAFLNTSFDTEAAMVLADNNATLNPLDPTKASLAVWAQSFKIMLVRNPFDRLVSAYYDKMLTTSDGFSYYYEPISRSINQQYKPMRRNANDRNKPDDGTATFEDFVNFLLHNKTHFTQDFHWQMYNRTCEPCRFKYDYIAKFETLNDDMKYLKEKFGLSDYHRKGFFPQGVFQTDPNKTKRVFEKIPSYIRKQLYKKYSYDFELFGYDRPAWL